MPITIMPPPGLKPPVKRADLEYPTEDVTFTYLAAINKLRTVSGYGGGRTSARWILTVDSFTDKAIELSLIHI